jgi:hypothetical protein
LIKEEVEGWEEKFDLIMEGDFEFLEYVDSGNCYE